jgi:hypothetical protein
MGRFTYREQDGREFSTGLVPRTTKLGGIRGVPVWAGESCPILPASDLTVQEPVEPYIVDADYGMRDLNQGSHPSCTNYAGANAMQTLQAKRGRPVAPFDPYTLWVELTGGRGGTAIDAVAERVASQGMPLVGGDRLKVTEAWDIPSLEAFLSAMALGCTVLFGWSGLGPHAECGVRISESGDPEVLNSWGRSWGKNGLHVVPRSGIASGIRTFGAVAFREIEPWGAK